MSGKIMTSEFFLNCEYIDFKNCQNPGARADAKKPLLCSTVVKNKMLSFFLQLGETNNKSDGLKGGKNQPCLLHQIL